jgi:hypothetical protein
MYILFEEHQYNSHDVEKVLKDIYVLQDVDKMVRVQYVGYFYNPHLHDCVFILPKVLLTDKETLVGMKKKNGEDATPEDVLSPDKQKENLSQEYRKFIYEFSVWIYRALSVFYKSNPKSKAILYKHLPQAGRGKRAQAKTFLDIVLSLINFNQENRDFVLFTIKNLHKGNNKINWTRTIGHSQSFIQGDDVIYLKPINKKRIVNYEEELFIIFFSILNFLNEEYGFRTPINIQYDLIVGKQFKQYMRGMGKVKLMQIKYKYFSDKALQLWDLCYAFFDNSYRIAVNTNAQEYLLARNFNIVFEAMIDELIGTPHSMIPKGLADQEDGKRVDHLYTDLALTSAEKQSEREVYYIGDSKYYKSGHDLTSESIYKQYTYARNVIQWNVNLFAKDDSRFDEKENESRVEDKERFGKIRLQDDSITEGYDVIPNFFISAFVYDNLQYNDEKQNIKEHKDTKDKHCTKVSFQFPDRLFDRDTLFLSQYDVNFLYILYLYARNKANEKAIWKHHVRKIFREEIRGVIQDKFKVYAMRAKLGVDASLYLQQHFYELNGRVFQPYGEERKIYFAYARPAKHLEKTQEQYEELKKYFVIEECGMGKDPQEVLQPEFEKELQQPLISPQFLTVHYLERYADKGVMVGYYQDEDHLKMILGNNDEASMMYNVRLDDGDNPRPGSHPLSFYKSKNVQFVILYTKDYKETKECRVFHVKSTTTKLTGKQALETWQSSEKKGAHFFYRFDEEVNLGKIDIVNLIQNLQVSMLKNGGYTDGEPLFTNAEDVLKYRKGF